MTQTPAGWYPEPDPTYTGPSGRLRYWDGTQWTEHVQDPAPVATPAPPTYPAGTTPAQYGQPWGEGYSAQPQYGTQPQYGPGPATTPDGQALAGWWQRVLAQFLDFLISIPLFVLAAAPTVATQWDNLSQWVDDLDYAAENGTADPPDPALLDPSQGPFWAMFGSIMLASLLYQIVFLAWKQATPGKLIVGLRVRLRDRPELPVATIVLRVLSVFVLGLCWIVQILDYLWPLWDEKKQALHDKMARTNVVKAR